MTSLTQKQTHDVKVIKLILVLQHFIILQSYMSQVKLGSNVKSKIHDDLTGHVVVYQPLNNYAVIMTDVVEYEMMTVECYLSDLEVA